jgi:hypothetical protein
MIVSRRLFLRHTATVGAVAATASVPEAQAEPVRTPREQAIWHLRQLEQLTRETGAKKVHAVVLGDYGRGDCRALAIQDSGKLVDREDMFTPKGGAA